MMLFFESETNDLPCNYFTVLINFDMHNINIHYNFQMNTSLLEKQSTNSILMGFLHLNHFGLFNRDIYLKKYCSFIQSEVPSPLSL